MKQFNFLLSILIYSMITACGQEVTINNATESGSLSKTSDQEPSSIFQELSDKVKDLHNEDSSILTRKLSKDDGTNVYDEVIKEIQHHDEESGGQVSSMIETIIAAADKEMGVDVTELLKDNLEKSNDFINEFEGEFEDIEKLIPQETAKNVLEGLQDFIKTGGENGGVEKILGEFVKHQKETNPESAHSDWIQKIEDILQNPEKSFEKEVEQVLIEALKSSGREVEDLRLNN